VFEFIFFVILLRFVEIVHIELANKRRKVVVFEVFGQNFFRELIYVFHNKGISLFIPRNDVKMRRILEK